MSTMYSESPRAAVPDNGDSILSARVLGPAAPTVFGSQVVLDLYECETEHLDDLEWVKRTLANAARAAGATIVQTVFHQFAPCGISGVVVIAESHLAIHTWPENRYAAIDVFTCGENVQVDAASAYLTRKFRSKRALQRRFMRGDQVSTNRKSTRPPDGQQRLVACGVVPRA